MEELYWITRLDGIYTCACIIAALCSVVTLVMYAVSVGNEVGTYFKTTHKRFAILALVGILGVIFVPTTKEALVIYGVGGTIDYVKQDTVVQKLPQKAIIALDKYLESINNNNE
jgi:hypothetical protein